MKAWVLAGCVLAGALCACNEQQPPAQPGSFDRPTRVAFACFDLTDPAIPRVASLSSCDLAGDEAVSGDVITHALHAFVVQSSRGEVAAVDLLNQVVLDSRRDIPGYTFLPVGELPTAIAVPTTARHAAFTYVANAGSRDITVLKTQAFRELGAKESPTVQTLKLPGGSKDAPFDMVLSPQEDALFVSMPETGRVLRVPIERCNGSSTLPDAPIMSEAGVDGGTSEAGAGDPTQGDGEPTEPSRPCLEGQLDAEGITEVPIRDSIALSAMDSSPDIEKERYLKTCDYKGTVSNASLPLPELPADIANMQSKPAGMAVDNFCERDKPCRRRLLIADQGLPLIHVIDFDAQTGGSDVVQTPIRSGVPTTSVVVTPRVPVDTSSDPAETQYVYAIDATDGSVLVTENGRLLQVGAEGARPDRVSLGGGTTVPIALSLGVMTPAFDVHGRAFQHATVVRTGANLPEPTAGNFCTDTAHTLRSNLRLRGVFIAVGVTDGSIRVIDIHDMDLAECRSCDKYRSDCSCGEGLGNRCDACAIESWDPYPVVRHRTRIAQTADRNADPPPLAPIAQPAFASGNSIVGVRVTGTTSDPRIRGLECVRCGEGEVLAFPDEDALVASSGGVVTGTTDGGVDTMNEPCASDSGRVCVQNDPWTPPEDWVAVYQGALPGSRGGDGILRESDDRLELQQSNGHFCQLGVEGSDLVPDKTGDQLDVVGLLATDDAIKATAPHSRDPNTSLGRSFESDIVRLCKDLVAKRDDVNDPVPIAFTIQQAFDDRLVLSPNMVTRPVPPLPIEFENDWQFVNKCFGGMPLTYEVRAGSGWLVLGRDISGYVHSVRAEEGTGRCVLEDTKDRHRNGRAYENEPFDNGFVTFQIRPPLGKESPLVDTTLVLNVVTTTPKTTVNTSVVVNTQTVASIPVDLKWSQGDASLYMIDIASRGLVQLVVDPWSLSGVSRAYQ